MGRARRALRWCGLASLVLLSAAWQARGQGLFSEPDLLLGPAESFRVAAQVTPAQQAPGGKALVRFSFSVAPGHYVWKDGLAASLEDAPAGLRAGELVLPAPKRKQDPYAGTPVDYYDGEFAVELVLDVTSEAQPGEHDLALLMRYTGCGPQLCEFRRDQVTAKLTVLPSGVPTPVALPRQAAPAPAPAEEAPAAGVAGDAGVFAGLSPLLAVLVAFGVGLGLVVTPCVYPLIPVTIALVGATSGRGRLDGFVRSLAYVFGISVTYAAAGWIASSGGAQFGTFLQHPAVYAALAVLFVALAGAMFDLYAIDLASQRLQRLQAKLHGRAGLAGIWLIGVLSGAAATACIAPIVVFALTYVAQHGSPALGALIFFAMAWGMGAPLVVLGTFSGLAQALPKSGEWLNVVKRAFGLALIGVALYYLGRSRLLSDSWFRMLVGATLLTASVFVGAFDRLTAQDGWWPRLRKAVGLLMAIGAAAAFLGPALARMSVGAGEQPGVLWLDSEQQALAQAKAEGKPVLLDFWAEFCVPCHVMLKTTFVDPDVVAESKRFVCAKVDIGALSDDERERVATQYGVFGVPSVVLIDAEGRLQTAVGEKGPAEMLALMRAVP